MTSNPLRFTDTGNRFTYNIDEETMTSNPPPNGRWYVCTAGPEFFLDDGSNGAPCPDCHRIPAWSAANWDEPPEYVMAPEDMGDLVGIAVCKYPPDGTFYIGSAPIEGLVVRWSDSVAEYATHSDHPEVLRRVWVREGAPSPVDKRGETTLPPGWTFDACVREGGGWLASASSGDMYGSTGSGETPQAARASVADAAWRCYPVSTDDGPVAAGSQAGESPAPTNPGEVGSKLGPTTAAAPESVDYPQNRRTGESPSALPPSDGTAVTFSDARGLTQPDLRAIMQDQARRRDLFDGLRMAYQTGAEPVAMTAEFFEALEKQRGKR